jgi:hypothetical protein
MAIALDAQPWNVFQTSLNAQAELLALLENGSVLPITAVSNQLLNVDLLPTLDHQRELHALVPHQLFAQLEFASEASKNVQRPHLHREDFSMKILISLQFSMVDVQLLRRDALEVSAYSARSFVLKSSTAHLIPSDALIILALLPLASATVQPAPVSIMSNAGMAYVLMMILNAQQDLHAQIASQSNATTEHALNLLVTALNMLPVLPTSQFAATLETADNTKTIAQPFLPALNLCQFFARMAHAENPFNTVKVLPTLPSLKERFAALMAPSHSHSRSAQPALLAPKDTSNAGMELVQKMPHHAPTLLISTKMLSDAQMVL